MCVGKFVTEWMLEWGGKYSFCEVVFVRSVHADTDRMLPLFYSRIFFLDVEKNRPKNLRGNYVFWFM